MFNIIISILLISPAAIASPFGFSARSLAVKAEMSYLESQKNYNDAGSLTILSQQNKISELKLDLSSTYDFSRTWGIYSRLSIKQLNTQTSTYNLTVTGVSDVILGTDLLLTQWGKTKIIGDFSVLVPLSGVPGADRTAFFSDGAYGFSAKSFFNFNFDAFKNYVYAGFTYRTLGLSSQIPLGFMTRYFFNPKFFASLSADGELTFSNDQFSAAPAQRFIVNQNYNASSQLYNSVNPQWASLKIDAGVLAFSNITLAGGVKYVVWGQRIADETRFILSIGYQSSLESDKKFQPNDQDKFQVDTEE